MGGLGLLGPGAAPAARPFVDINERGVFAVGLLDLVDALPGAPPPGTPPHGPRRCTCSALS